VTRNPLASPDILGITTGASAAAVTVIVLGGGSTGIVGWLSDVGIPVASLIGAFLTGAVIWVLAYRRGVDPFRLVLAGIVISALLSAFINFLMTRANIDDAASAQMWLAGSLNSADWSRVRPVLVVVVLLSPAVRLDHLPAVRQRPRPRRGQGTRPERDDRPGTAAGPVRHPRRHGRRRGRPDRLRRLRLPAGRPVDLRPRHATDHRVRPVRAMLLLAADIITQSWLPVELPVGLLTSAVGVPVPHLPAHQDEPEDHDLMTNPASAHDHSISATNLRVGYTPDRAVISDLSLKIPAGRSPPSSAPTAAASPPCCAPVGRLIPSQGGDVHLGNTDIGGMKRKDIAKTIGVLPQSPIAPPGLIVSDLVSRGRHPPPVVDPSVVLLR
jgi:ABC-type multidrug transport system fused ATPase/permease subunit